MTEEEIETFADQIAGEVDDAIEKLPLQEAIEVCEAVQSCMTGRIDALRDDLRRANS